MNESRPDLTIQHTEAGARGAFYIELDGKTGLKRVAEQAYTRIGPDRVVIVHTEVGPELQGRGVARMLLNALVAWARETGTRVSATCSYAKAQFEKDASIRDVFEP